MILVENESNWETEDLKALVDKVCDLYTTKSGLSRDNWLLLFRTSRVGKRTYVPHGHKLPAASFRGTSKDHARTLIVEIRAPKHLRMEILDQMATIASGVKQDMNSESIGVIAQCIREALVGNIYRPSNDRKENWAQNYAMRSRPRIIRSAEVARRRIEAIEQQKNNLTAFVNKELRTLGAAQDKIREQFGL